MGDSSDVLPPVRAPKSPPSGQRAPSGKSASFAPEDFVNRCYFLEVDCKPESKAKYFYGGTDNEYVQLTYMSASSDHGGNAGAAVLKQAVEQVLKKRGLGSGPTFFGASDFDYMKLFTGQPKLPLMAKLAGMVLDYDEDFKAITIQGGKGKVDFAKFYEGSPASPIAKMRDAKFFGMDCIGFVSRYLEAAGVMPYPALLPRQFLDKFEPVQDVAEVDDLCVTVRCDGSHVQIIDRVTSRSGNTLSAVIGQSATGGPQRNQVTFKAGSSDDDGNDDEEIQKGKKGGILDIAQFNKDQSDFEADARASGLRPVMPKRERGKDKEYYEAMKVYNAEMKTYAAKQEEQRQASLKSRRLLHTKRGYKNGLIFLLSGNDTTGVVGLFYIGRLPGGIAKGY